MKTIVILGMHRSATSLVAKGLNSVIHLGAEEDMLEPAKDNPEGFFENKKFLELNDRILSKAGGNWLEPPSEKAILDVEIFFVDEIQKLVKSEGAKHAIWGWKDPRTTLTIRLFDKWLNNPHYVACFRDRTQVAESLSKRNAYSINKGLICADIYNARLLQFLIDKHLPIMKEL